MAIHHLLDPDAGASGSVMEIGTRLRERGHDVDFFGFDQAFRNPAAEARWHYVAFPWCAAGYMSRHRHAHDIVDISVADAWLWASLRGARGSNRCAVVGRSHGLENLAAQAEVELLKREGRAPGWKYRLYHAGYRQWELRRSFRAVDHLIVLNGVERETVLATGALMDEQVSVIPHGVSQAYLQDVQLIPSAGRALRLAFIGTWIPRKGTSDLVEIARGLRETGTDYELSLLGTVKSEADVIAEFHPEDRAKVRVVTRYHNDDLPDLLAGHDILLFLSNFEGFGKVVIEAMACGLAGVSTRVGIGAEIIADNTGIAIPPYDPGTVVAAIAELSRDRPRLDRMRAAAHQAARAFTWDAAIDKTEAAYDRAVAVRKPAALP